MQRRRLLKIVLAFILILSGGYVLFVIELPILIRASQRLNVTLNWQDVDRVMVQRLQGMSSEEARLFLNDLFLYNVDVEGREPFYGPCDDTYGEWISLGTMFHARYYIACYTDGKIALIYPVDF